MSDELTTLIQALENYGRLLEKRTAANKFGLTQLEDQTKANFAKFEQDVESLDRQVVANTKTGLGHDLTLKDHEVRISHLEHTPVPVPPTDPELNYFLGDENSTFMGFSDGGGCPFSLLENNFAVKYKGKWIVSNSEGVQTVIGATSGMHNFLWANQSSDEYWWKSGLKLYLRKFGSQTLAEYDLPDDPGIAWYPGSASGQHRQFLYSYQNEGGGVRRNKLLDFTRQGLGEPLDMLDTYGRHIHNVSKTAWGYAEDPSAPYPLLAWVFDGTNDRELEEGGDGWSHPTWFGNHWACYSAEDRGVSIFTMTNLGAHFTRNITIPNRALKDILETDKYVQYQHGSLRRDALVFSARTFAEGSAVDAEKDEISLWLVDLTNDYELSLIVSGLKERSLGFYDQAKPSLSMDGTLVAVQTKDGPRIFKTGFEL